MTDKSSDGLRKTFDAILSDLIKTIGASRTTLRLDETKYGFHIDDVVYYFGEVEGQRENGGALPGLRLSAPLSRSLEVYSQTGFHFPQSKGQPVKHHFQLQLGVMSTLL